MEQKFEQKNAVEYFLKSSTQNIEDCYNYFKKAKIGDQKKQKIFDSEKEAPSFAEKLLHVYTSLDVQFQSNVFIKSESSLKDDQEIANKSVSPIPSVQLTGNFRAEILTMNSQI